MYDQLNKASSPESGCDFTRIRGLDLSRLPKTSEEMTHTSSTTSPN
jgi:hypothetical protein